MTLVASRSALNLFLLCAGLTIWASAFVVLYAVLSLGCAFGWEERMLGPVTLQRGILVAAWLAHLPPIVGIWVWVRRRERALEADDGLGRFFARTTLWATAISLGVTVINYAPILTLSTCL